MDEPYPDFVARFYDTVYAQIRDGVDNTFYAHAMAAAGAPVLEIGVGTGRLLVEARRQGADAWGIDLSPSMVEKARGRLAAHDRDRVQVADAVTMKLGRRFALIVAPFRVLSHVARAEDQLRLLRNVSEHLEPGGRFIFDVFVPSPRLMAEGMHGLVDFDGEWTPGRRLRRVIDATSDVVSQTTKVSMRFEWQEEDGTKRSGEWNFDMRLFFRFELEHLLARSPLALESIHGDFEGGPLGPDSREMVVTARKTPR